MKRYRYFGLIFGRVNVTVSLDDVAFGNDLGDHAAAWAGVNAPRNRAWVQGGVEIEAGDKGPFAYIEVGRDGRQESLVRFPFHYGEPLKVKLRRRPAGWVVTVEGVSLTRVSPPVRIGKGATVDATLETYGDVRAAATIDGKPVRAPGGYRGVWRSPRH